MARGSPGQTEHQSSQTGQPSERVSLDPVSDNLTLAFTLNTYLALPGMGHHTHRHGSPGCPLYMSPSAGLLQCSLASLGAPYD